MSPPPLDVRFVQESEWMAYRKAAAEAFGGDYSPDEQMDARFAASFRRKTAIGGFDGEQLVATANWFDFELRVPGGSVPMAGTTIVSVMPTHRRRGLLTRMMQLHLDSARAAGQPVAGLWATEFGIYRRFGFGPASEIHKVEFDTRRTSIPREPTIRLVPVDTERARSVARPIFNDATGSRPGTYARPDWYWEHRVFTDPEKYREGMTEQKWVVAEEDGRPIGYVRYRTKLKWDDAGPEGEVSVIELIATTDAATRALWHLVSTVDLHPNVTYWNRPVDDPLPWLVSDLRQLRHSVAEALWVRLLDVPAALMARRYASDSDVVISVNDPTFTENSGRWRVQVVDGTATVERTEESPDVELDVDVLGSLYLGTHRAQMLARANMLTGTEAGIESLDHLMAWPVPAWTEAIF